MADPRLRINQIAAPNFTGASVALANANRSFNNAFDSADKILADYNTGQQQKEDALLASELAGLKYEDDFGAFVDGGGLAGRNLSPEMQQTVLGMRKNLLGNDSTRAGTESTRASTSRANAAEARKQFNFDDEVARTKALRSAAGLGVQAESIGRVAGSSGSYDLGVSGQNADVQRQVYDGLLKRGVPEHVAQGFMMNFQDESGFNIDIEEGEANVHGTKGRGLYQLTGARRDAFEAQFGGDYSIDNQLDFLIQELGGNESRAFEAIRNTSTAGEAGAAIVSSFLRPAEKHRLERSNRYTGQSGYTVPANRENLQAQTGLTAYQQNLIDSGLFNTDEILSRSQPIRDAQALGDAAIQKDADAVVAEIAAAAQLGAIQGDSTTAAGVVQDTVQNAGDNLTATEKLRLAQQTGELTNDPAIQALIAPPTTIDPVTQSTADLTNAAISNAVNSTPQTRMASELPRYAENPTETLIEDLGLSNDQNAAGPVGAFISGGTAGSAPNDIKNLINRYASQFKVSPEVAAVAMREAFVNDPTSFLGVNANTLENRFPEAAVEAIIKGDLDQRNIDLYNRRSEAAGQIQKQTETILNQIRTLQSRALKPGADTATLNQEIADLTIALSQIQGNNAITGNRAEQLAEEIPVIPGAQNPAYNFEFLQGNR